MFKKVISVYIIINFIITSLVPPTSVQAQTTPQTVLNLPTIGSMVFQSPAYFPASIKGLRLDRENPLRFSFIIDSGEDILSKEELEKESLKLVKYFLASLTVPEEELWVNLSPYEPERIIPKSFGDTEMGRDLLAQDYMLKQLTSSLMYPEKELGKSFWDRLYKKAAKYMNINDLPVSTFNKVWIIPEKAVVFEHNQGAYVVESHLKVMLEEDYVAMHQSMDSNEYGLKGANQGGIAEKMTEEAKEAVKNIILPEIEREVNKGETFSNLRQIFNAMILATWYKQNLRNTLLSQVYVDRAKTKGIDLEDKEVNQKIYDQYIQSFRQGVYNYIREDYDPIEKNPVYRQYYSGGGDMTNLTTTVETFKAAAMLSPEQQAAYDNAMGSLFEVDFALLATHESPDVLTRMVSRAPDADRVTWEAQRRRRASIKPKVIGQGVVKMNKGDVEFEDDPPAVHAEVIKEALEMLKDLDDGAFIKGLGLKGGIEFRVAENYEGTVGLEGGVLYFDAQFLDTLGFKLGEHVLENDDYDYELRGTVATIEGINVRIGTQMMLALDLVYNLHRQKGLSNREAMAKMLEVYKALQANDERRKEGTLSNIDALHQVLRSDVVDSDNLMSFFLKKATGEIPKLGPGADLEEQEKYEKKSKRWFRKIFKSIVGSKHDNESYPHSLPGSGGSVEDIKAKDRTEWEEKMTVWFLASRDMDFPVDIEEIDRILANQAEESGDVIAQQLLDLVEKNYDSDNERKNARRKMRELLENDQFLSVARYGRASYYLMMLAATSEYIANVQAIEEKIEEIEKFIAKHSGGPDSSKHQKIATALGADVQQLRKYANDLRVLIQPHNKPTIALLTGSTKKLQKAVRGFTSKSLELTDEKADGDDELRKFVLNVTDALGGAAVSLLQAVENAPGKRMNFSVLMQRASITGEQARANMVLGNDPFRGGEAHIADIFREGGDMTYTSRDDIWFEYAQYWIEALPLFIHEEEEKLSDGRTVTKIVIEQDTMEDVLRRLSVRFKRNINNVMDSEHVEIARVLIATRDERFKSRFEDLKEENKDTSDEEIALHILREEMDKQLESGSDDLERLIAHTAAEVEEYYREHAEEISERQQDENILRYDALKQEVLEGEELPEALTAPSLPKAVAEETKPENGSTYLKSDTVARLMEEDMPYAKRREIPTWMILTTQAPGMSNAFAGHWVDEEMALSNITEGFTHEGKTLEKEAREIQKARQARIVAIGRHVVRQFGKSGEVDKLITDSDGKMDDTGAILTLIYQYQDIAEEVARIMMIEEIYDAPEEERDGREPEIVRSYIEEKGDELKAIAIKLTIQQNPELNKQKILNRLIGENNDKKVIREFEKRVDQEIYGIEVEKYLGIRARADITLRMDEEQWKMYAWYAYAHSKKVPPNIIHYSLGPKGMTFARQEVIQSYWRNPDGRIVPIDSKDRNKEGQSLVELVNDPLYNYAAEGRNKKYNRGYFPSRVDLGNLEDESVRVWTQWLGGADRHALQAMMEFAKGYNQNPFGFSSVRHAETKKPEENSLMEATLAVSHLFIGLMHGIGVGNFMSFIHQTNQRSEVFVRPGGCGASGFCQTKDIYWLQLVTDTARQEILKYAGEPINTWAGITNLHRIITRAIDEVKLPDNKRARAIKDMVRAYVNSYLEESSAREKVGEENEKAIDEASADPEAAAGFAKSPFLKPSVAVPPVTSIEAFGEIGMGDPVADVDRFLSTLVAGYHGEVVTALEGRTRFAPVNVIKLLRQGFNEAYRLSGGKTALFKDGVLVFSEEYKPVSDARFSPGLRILELLAAVGEEHLMLTFGEEGRQLARLIVYGFDRSDEYMTNYLRLKAIEQGYQEKDIEGLFEALEEGWPRVDGPRDIRIFSPFNLSWTAAKDYIADNKLDEVAEQVRGVLIEAGVPEDQIDANILSYGTDLEKWTVLRELYEFEREKFYDLKEKIGRRLPILALKVRVENDEYRQGPGSDVWDAHRGVDVFVTMIDYLEMSGSEEEGEDPGSFGQRDRMLDDLARIMSTMREGRPESAGIWLDAKVQGRKPSADLLARKQWMALGGHYVSPMIAQDDVQREREEVQKDSDLMEELTKALKAKDFEKAEKIHAQFVELARKGGRYEQAENEYEQVKYASTAYRGGGLNNLSVRHSYYLEAWAKLNQGLELDRLDIGTMMFMGLMYHLNGKSEKDIREEIEAIRAALQAYRASRAEGAESKVTGFSDDQAAEITYLFVKPKHEELGKKEIKGKGVSSSLKAAEDDAKRAEGQALNNYFARKKAAEMRKRTEGYKSATRNQIIPDEFGGLHAAAKSNLTNKLAGPLPSQNFGRFLGYTRRALVVLIKESNLDPEEKAEMLERVETYFNKGRELSPDNWQILMGKGDDIGVLGRLALDADGDKGRLEYLVQMGGLLDIAGALALTLEYHQMSDEDLERLGPEAISAEIFKWTAMFFSESLYDHVFDYFPMWMQPTKSDHGFTDYETIFGKWLGEGAPLTREEVLKLALRSHEWLGDYFRDLFATKTHLRQRMDEPGFRENLFGTEIDGQYHAPLTAGSTQYSEVENRWWAYTQLREIATNEQQGHSVVGVFEDFDMNEISDCDNCVNLGVTAPIGRPHLSVWAAEGAKHHQQAKENGVNLFLARGIETGVSVDVEEGSKETVNVASEGFLYLSREDYIKARKAQLMKWGIDDATAELRATRDAEKALAKNPNGIPVLVRFKEAQIIHMDIPLHGSPTYQAGEGEAIGLPSTQPWGMNVLGYSKLLQWFIYGNQDKAYVPEEVQWFKRYQYEEGADPTPENRLSEDEVIRRLVEGHDNFVGLRKLVWLGGIAKPAQQSGGRGIVPLNELRDPDGTINEEKMYAYAKLMAEQGYKDDLVVQRFLSSTPLWASGEFIDEVRQALVRDGNPLPPDAQITTYSRVITTYKDNDPNKPIHVMELTVASRQAVSNVGQQGALFKWRKSFVIDGKTDAQIMKARREAAEEAMKLIEEFNRRMFRIMTMTEDEYAEWRVENTFNTDKERVNDAYARKEYKEMQTSFPDFQKMKDRWLKAPLNEEGDPVDATGWSYLKPRYLMNDFIDVPIVRMPDGEEITAPDIISEKRDRDGNLEYFVVVDTRKEGKWKLVKRTASDIVGYKAAKIEDNIGYGLYQPRTRDEMREEQLASRREGRPVNPLKWGADLRIMMTAWGEMGKAYKDAKGLNKLEGPVPTSERPKFEERAEPKEKSKASAPAISEDEINIALEDILFRRVIEEGLGLETWRKRIRITEHKTRRRLSDLLSAQLLGPAAAEVLEELEKVTQWSKVTDKKSVLDYLDSVVPNILDRVYTESSERHVQVVLDNKSREEMNAIAGGGDVNHVLVFDSPLGLVNELAAVHASSVLSQAELPTQRINVIATRTKWINDDGTIQKAYVIDVEIGEVKLITFNEPVRPDRVQMMELHEAEIPQHSSLSARFRSADVPMINSRYTSTTELTAAAVVDSKAHTAQNLENIVSISSTLLVGSEIDLEELKAFVEDLLDKSGKEEIKLRLRPDSGTGGAGHEVVSIKRSDLESFDDSHPLVTNIQKISESGGEEDGQNVAVSEENENLAYYDGNDGRRRASIRINVASAYPGEYEGVSGFGNVGAPGVITSNSDIIRSIPEVLRNLKGPDGRPVTLNHGEFEKLKAQAIRAVRWINRDFTPDKRLRWAGVDVGIEILPDGSKRFVIFEINARPTGLRHAHRIDNKNDEGKIGTSKLLWQVEELDKVDALMKILREDLDENYVGVIGSMREGELKSAIERVIKYLGLDIERSGDPLIYLKQQMAIVALAELLRVYDQYTLDDNILFYVHWMLKTLGIRPKEREATAQTLAKAITAYSQKAIFLSNLQEFHTLTESSAKDIREAYLSFINPFLELANRLELRDFDLSVEKALEEIDLPSPGSLRFQGEGVHRGFGPMRFGLSSANASDNYTNVKLRGGMVLNAAIDIDGQIPINVEVAKAKKGQIVLEVIGGLQGGPYQTTLTSATIGEFDNYHDPSDPYRMLKYALVFTGIVSAEATGQEILDQIDQFTDGKGLHIRVTSNGPSRSGFASSSSVAAHLLHALYKASGQEQFVQDKTLLGTLALLLENRLGLKSGRQDVDGPIFPGVKEITYPRTTGLVAPQRDNVRVLPMEGVAQQVFENVLMVDTGIPRSAQTDVRRGLNMRHLALLSRQTEWGFRALEQSRGIHAKIREAAEAENWPAVGRYFTEYMALREKIDTGATWSKFDDVAGEPVLRKIFDPLIKEGLIYGGMFTGAMGGGVSMLVLTDKGKEKVDGDIRRIDVVLNQLRSWELEASNKQIKKWDPTANNAKTKVAPYRNLRKLDVSLNTEGTQHQHLEGESIIPFDQAVGKTINADDPKAEAMIVRENQTDSNAAMEVNLFPSVSKSDRVGGINLNPAQMQLEIRRDQNGVPLPMDQQPDDAMLGIEGFVPYILQIQLLPTMPPLVIGENSQENQTLQVSRN